jgi:hypothetical protein
MRRDYFELEVENVDWTSGDEAPAQPTLHIEFHGPDDLLRERLTGRDGELLAAQETDVSFRLHDPVDDPEGEGVLGVSNRVTGDFVLELNQETTDVVRFIRATREYGQVAGADDGRYRVAISIGDDPLVEYEKRTFLVYDADGDLLRGRSLIPSGVEL